MNDSDFERFREGLSGVFALYEKELTPFILDLWWAAMKRFDLEEIVHGFNRHVQNTEQGKWLPKPADIIKMIEGSSEDSALIAWAKVDRTLREKGPYVDVVFDDCLIHRVLHDMGGWSPLGTKNDEEWPFVAREFQNRYRGYRSKGEKPDYPKVLIGIANAYNGMNGHELEPCVMVGDKEKCQKVLTGGNDGRKILEFSTQSLQIEDKKIA